MSYRIRDLDKGFDDFFVDDIKGIQKYVHDLEQDKDTFDKVNVETLDTFERIKTFLNENYNIDVEEI